MASSKNISPAGPDEIQSHDKRPVMVLETLRPDDSFILHFHNPKNVMTPIDKKLERVSKKIDKFKKQSEKYRMEGFFNGVFTDEEPWTEDEIAALESKHNVTIPQGYREFLLRFGFSICPYETPAKRNRIPRKMSENCRYHNEDAERQSPGGRVWPPNDFMDVSNYIGYVPFVIGLSGKERGNIWYEDQEHDVMHYVYPYKNRDGRLKFLDWVEWHLDEANTRIMAREVALLGVLEKLQIKIIKRHAVVKLKRRDLKNKRSRKK